MSEQKTLHGQIGGSVVINSQYIKDFSFENPNAPYSLINSEKPNINIDLDIRADHIHDSMFEVVINVRVQSSASKPIFVIDLAYGGLFTIAGDVTVEEQEIILLVHCANILFPYVRQIISNATLNGGYPPLLLSPVDFMGLYQQKKITAIHGLALSN
jgi:preprotein translocase subunit SecB